ncbi:MAG: hypothetical protein NZ922_04975 [Candidatus Methanomethyliaceae archaeon]|nr:hypothetical protein [Candidatus Methanomethyliaceae archaeon]MDW7970718.1 hypothetical protein [Nitrososphaerota archaeon]
MEISHENISGYGCIFKLRGYAEIKSFAIELIKTIADELMRRGARGIGHIKLHIEGKNEYLRADTIGLKYGVYIEGLISSSEEYITTINAISLGLRREDVEEIVHESIIKISKKHGLEIINHNF